MSSDLEAASIVQPDATVVPASALTSTNNPPAQHSPASPSASLHVSNLDPSVTDATLFEVFNMIGPVASVRVLRDAASGCPLVFAYVNYMYAADAQSALGELNHSFIKNRPCRIVLSRPDPSLRKNGQGNIYVNNLDEQIDQKALCDAFAHFGDVVSCKVFTDESGRSKGYGFVLYESVEVAEAAIKAANGMPLNGKNLYVSHYKSREERQSKREEEAQATDVNIESIKPSVTKEEAEAPFQQINEIPDGIRTVFTGSSTVIVAEEDDETPGAVHLASKVTAQPSPKSTAERKFESSYSEAAASSSCELTSNNNPPAQYSAAPATPSASLHVWELDPSVTDAMLREVFEKFGPVKSIHIRRDAASGHSLGYAYVNYQNVADAQRALKELNYSTIKGQTCRITWSQPDPALRKTAQGNIYVSNLDEQIDEKARLLCVHMAALHDAFVCFGNVLSCKVATDDQGRPKGHGFINYETTEAAERAINVANGTVLNGKQIRVSPYRSRKERESKSQMNAPYTNVNVENTDSVTKEEVEAPFQQSGKVPDGIRNVPVGSSAVIVAEEGDDTSGTVHTASKAVIQYSKPTAKEAADPSSLSISEAPKYPVLQPRPQELKPGSAKGDRSSTPPLAKGFSRERSTPLSNIQGTGLEGRITCEDVDEHQPPASTAALAKPPAEHNLNSNTPEAIGTRSTHSKQELPQHYLTMEINMDEVLKLCERLNEKLEDKDESTKLSVDDFILKAVACALADVPTANSARLGQVIKQYNKVDISMAVVTPTGLMAPTIKDVGSKGLATISAEAKTLAKKARECRLIPQEYEGGTFTISNLSTLGIDHFTAIINPRQSCNLAVGCLKSSIIPCLEGERGFKTCSIMKVTLSSDYRVVDSAVGARWLAALKGYLEDPWTLLL
ncbi:2-oxoacid dehydrogenases acyltransferase-domain-containing protein [Pisolithus croceorrhizus]|nr:2-oxoacid dehydrogenases acyltransferase-domain-containing protein [Pisolithus croceorrhizus]